MPNHVHVVVRPQPCQVLPRILRSWQSFTFNKINKLETSVYSNGTMQDMKLIIPPPSGITLTHPGASNDWAQSKIARRSRTR